MDTSIHKYGLIEYYPHTLRRLCETTYDWFTFCEILLGFFFSKGGNSIPKYSTACQDYQNFNTLKELAGKLTHRTLQLISPSVSKGKPNKPYTRLSVSFVNSVLRTHFDGEYNLISVILQYNIFHFLALKNSNFIFLTIISKTITQHLVRSNRIQYIYINYFLSEEDRQSRHFQSFCLSQCFSSETR